ncbi:MAG: DUF4236 domain-containing protein [Thermomicrobiales bacterium]
MLRNLLGGLLGSTGILGTYRRSKNLPGGVKVSSSNGVPTSVSVGEKGVRVTESGRGTRLTRRIPGTGITMTRNFRTGGTGRRRKKSSSDSLFG